MNYKEKKEQAREKAKSLQVYQFAQSWEEVAKDGERLYKLAKRCGLVREFRENGIL